MRNALEQRRYDFTLSLLNVTNLEEKLKDRHWHDVCYRAYNPVAALSHLYIRLDAEEVSIAEQILRKYPSSFFHRNPLPVIYAARHSCNPSLLRTFVELTDFSLWQHSDFLNLLGTPHSSNVTLVVTNLPPEFCTGEFLQLVFQRTTLAPDNFQELISAFTDEALRHVDSRGMTILHHLAGKWLMTCSRGLVMSVLDRAPDLLRVKDISGRIPRDIAQARCHSTAANDDLIDLLSPIVKGAM